MNRSWLVVPALLLLSLPAFAAEKPAVMEVKGDVKIGQEGAWKPATPGTAIGESEFLQVAADATVTVKLANGSPATFMGKAFIPGRRLMDPKMTVDGLMRFYKVYQKAATTIGGVEKTTSLAGAGKACEAPKIMIDGVCTTPSIRWAGEDAPKKRAPAADEMSKLHAEGKTAEARTLATSILNDPSSIVADRRRANLVLGVSSVGDGSFATALEHLDKAAAPIAKGEAGADKYRAQAQLERGKLLLQMGSDARAKADFEAALKGGERSVLSEAHYYLGFMALATNDDDTAQKQFAKIEDAKWKQIAKETQKVDEAN